MGSHHALKQSHGSFSQQQSQSNASLKSSINGGNRRKSKGRKTQLLQESHDASPRDLMQIDQEFKNHYHHSNLGRGRNTLDKMDSMET